MPNNREVATLVWIGLVAAWMVTQPSIRTSVWAAGQAMLTPRILVPLLLMVAWVFGEILLGAELGVWRASLTITTATWFLISAFALFLGVSDVAGTPEYLRRRALAAMDLGILAGILTETFVLPLLAEFFLVPFVVFSAGLVVVSSSAERLAPAKRLFMAVNVAVVLALCCYGAAQFVSRWDTLDKLGLVAQVFLPVWLTLGLLPFIYALGLYTGYELAFQRIDHQSLLSRRSRIVIKAALLLGFHVKAHSLGRFSGWQQLRFAEARTFSSARKAIQDFHREAPGLDGAPPTGTRT